MNPPKIIKRPSDIQMENNSMTASNGFNRKLKLTTGRPSSRDQRKGEIFPSLADQALNPYQIELINLFVDDSTFISSSKVELQSLQDEINTLDLDGRIRGVDAKQEYRLQSIKKWISTHNIPAKQIIDQKWTQQLDINRIIEALNQKTAEYYQYYSRDALIKLFKLVMIVDSMIQKMNEYEAIFLVKYDEIYSELCQNLQKQELQQVQAQKFQVSLLNLSRFADFIQYSSKLSQQLIEQKGQEIQVQSNKVNTQDVDSQVKKLINETANLQKQLKQKETIQKDLEIKINNYEKQIQQLTQNQFVNQQLYDEKLQSQIRQLQLQIQTSQQNEKQFQTQNNELNNQIKLKEIEIQKQKTEIQHFKQSQQTNIKEDPKVNTQTKDTGTKGSDYYKQILDNVANDYKAQLQSITADNMKLRDKIIEQNITIDNNKAQVTSLRDSVDQLVKIKDEIYEKFQKKYSSKEDFANSYEAALKLEFDAMKKTFEKKISELQQAQDKLKKESGRSINELRLSFEKEQETKRLLMNQLSLYV